MMYFITITVLFIFASFMEGEKKDKGTGMPIKVNIQV